MAKEKELKEKTKNKSKSRILNLFKKNIKKKDD